MPFFRDSVAKRPSLSTIDSIDSRRRPSSPISDHGSNFRDYKKEPQATVTEMISDRSPQVTQTSWVSPPKQMVRVPTTQTKYMEMLLHLDRIPRIYNILAGAFTWILLASFLIIPGTYTSFKNSDVFKAAEGNDDKSNAVAKAIFHSAANIGLLWLSGIFCFIGGFGCLFLWFRWRKNYVWIVNKVFLPATLNSFAGLLTTIVNVYTAQKGVWNITAQITAIVTGCLIAVSGTLFALYNFWMLEKVRDEHELHYYGGEPPRKD